MRYSQGENQTAIARFTVAVDRKYKKEGEATADFISCVAFGKTAEFIERYFNKGKRIGLVGRIQTGSYEKDGQKVYTTDVLAEEVEFVESANSGQTTPATDTNGFQNVSDSIEETLPFN
ncbi:MAG: single-stranded DNA-binding protein [Bacteroidales bacterium]|nr:single-stranded DNA-binding protein [Bacteroidales bacterium]